ncbi:hypothetical protein BT96DRAFT_986533 [Gymnopus androsaceus JB14]|uniref:Uncharacterized protein n=1 Tax=Gymnopus androsaceus JB14 TaxID=1447944 RepID=A0A6A4IAD7_9AGAR|nr:hypothetical protein BT96DRAFT_986533 [Gymnopus androsaceus JB14]
MPKAEFQPFSDGRSSVKKGRKRPIRDQGGSSEYSYYLYWHNNVSQKLCFSRDSTPQVASLPNVSRTVPSFVILHSGNVVTLLDPLLPKASCMVNADVKAIPGTVELVPGLYMVPSPPPLEKYLRSLEPSHTTIIDIVKKILADESRHGKRKGDDEVEEEDLLPVTKRAHV